MFVSSQFNIIIDCKYQYSWVQGHVHLYNSHRENTDEKYENDPDCQWIPLGLKVLLRDDGSVDMEQIADDVSTTGALNYANDHLES